MTIVYFGKIFEKIVIYCKYFKKYSDSKIKKKKFFFEVTIYIKFTIL